MNITILPYLDTALAENTKKTAAAGSGNTPASPSSFDENLRAAKRAVNAMTADYAIARAKQAGAHGFDLNSELAVALGISVSGSASNTASSSSGSAGTASNTASSSSGSAGTASSASSSSSGSATGAASSASSSGISGNASSEYSDDLACPAELEAYFKEASDTYGVSIRFLKSIAKAESNFQTDATSKSGAMGVMQLMPFTAEELGVSDAYNAHDNIMGGSKLLSQLLQKYDNNLSLAAAAYNAGSNSVDKYGGIPPFPETQNYVEKVLSYYNG